MNPNPSNPNPSPNRCGKLTSTSFKDGNITIPADDDDDPDHVEALAGWNLAVTIDLKTQSVVVDPDADPDEQARQQAIWDFIHDKFDIPGDYSIERLYAKLAGESPRRLPLKLEY